VIRLYLDEDAGDRRLLSALRSRGIAVISAAEAGNLRWPDSQQLAFATEQSRTICTYNQRHFSELHAACLAEGRTHSGIVIMRRMYVSSGDRADAFEQLSNARTPESMRDALVYLSDWLDVAR
jgi:hypothetical protein